MAFTGRASRMSGTDVSSPNEESFSESMVGLMPAEQRSHADQYGPAANMHPDLQWSRYYNADTLPGVIPGRNDDDGFSIVKNDPIHDLHARKRVRRSLSSSPESIPFPKGSTTKRVSNQDVMTAASQLGARTVLTGTEPQRSMNQRRYDMRIEQLQDEIASLEREKQMQVPCTWKVIHRVYEPFSTKGVREEAKVWKAYLDQPRWYRGRPGLLPLAGTEPVSDVPSYLERHSDLAFIVFRDYGLMHAEGGHFSTIGETSRRASLDGYPEPFAESTRFVSEGLIDAVYKFLDSLPKHNGTPYGTDFAYESEIAAPYLPVFFHQEEFRDVAALLPHLVRGQWTMFQQYVELAFASEYIDVQRMFERGLVIPRYLKYLFKPGEVLHTPKRPNGEAVQATKLLRSLTPGGLPKKTTKNSFKKVRRQPH